MCVFCVFLDPVNMHICIKYKLYMTNHVGRKDGYGKVTNGCHFKNIGHNDYIFCMQDVKFL